MATSKKITELPAITSAANTDVLYVVHDPAGVPVSNKITIANLAKSINVYASPVGGFVFTNTTMTVNSTSLNDIVVAAGDVNNVKITTSNNSYQWSFGSDGQFVINGKNINFGQSGIDVPTTGRSNGEKLVLWDQEPEDTYSYSIGIEQDAMWFGVDTGNSAAGFTWYTGDAKVMDLTRGGQLSVNGQIKFPMAPSFKIVTCPDTSNGSLGDTAGSFAADNNHLYYCTEDYVTEESYMYTPMSMIDPNEFSWTTQQYGANTFWIPYFGSYNTDFPVPEVGNKIILNEFSTASISSVEENNSEYGMTYILYLDDDYDLSALTTFKIFLRGTANIWRRIQWLNEIW